MGRSGAQLQMEAGRVRILVLTWNFPPRVGGIEHVADRLCAGLRARGHSLRILTSHRPRSARGRDPADPTDVERAPLPGLAAYSLWATLAAVVRHIAFRPDAVLVTSLASMLPAWALALLAPGRIHLIVYGSDLLVAGRLYRLLARGLMRRCRRVIAISEHTRRLAIAAGAPPDRVVIIPPGFEPRRADAEAVRHAEERWRRETGGRRVLLTVGRLVRRKGVLELVERVMPAVVARHPDVLLLIAGEDAGASLIHKSEPMSERIRAAVDGLRLGNHVRLLGRVGDADVQALMRCADVFVLNVLDLPGDVEGFGIVFLEAGVEGVPSVATRVGGIPDAVADGETGLLVDAGDDEALAGAVSTLLNDGELRVRLGRQAAARALERFTWPSIAQRYEEELERGEASVRSMRRMR